MHFFIPYLKAHIVTNVPVFYIVIILSNSEPIQSRCAMLRYSKLTDAQVLARLLIVCEKENVSYADDGLEAVIFTAQGDMRQVCSGQTLGGSGGRDSQGDMRQVISDIVSGG